MDRIDALFAEMGPLSITMYKLPNILHAIDLMVGDGSPEILDLLNMPLTVENVYNKFHSDENNAEEQAKKDETVSKTTRKSEFERTLLSQDCYGKHRIVAIFPVVVSNVCKIAIVYSRLLHFISEPLPADFNKYKKVHGKHGVLPKKPLVAYEGLYDPFAALCGLEDKADLEGLSNYLWKNGNYTLEPVSLCRNFTFAGL